MKISQLDATKCQILRPKCTKFNFGPRPHWGACSGPPGRLAVFQVPAFRVGMGERMEMERVAEPVLKFFLRAWQSA